jgi:hypothetical protein
MTYDAPMRWQAHDQLVHRPSHDRGGQTRDVLLEPGVILTAEPIGKLVNLGRVWTGVLNSLSSLNSQDRAGAVKMMRDTLSAYEKATGGQTWGESDDAGHTRAADRRTTDGARRAAAMANTIGEMNRRNAEFWKQGA